MLATGIYSLINSGINVAAVDSSFTYAVVGTAIFKYSPTVNTFQTYKPVISSNITATP